MSDAQPPTGSALSKPAVSPPAHTDADVAAILQQALARTPARLMVGRAGPSYTTSTLLSLREDHAAARDAVRTEIDLARDFGGELVESAKLFLVRTLARSKSEYLLRPDLGRKLDEQAVEAIRQRCPSGVDLQVIIGDGLSSTAVARQVPVLLPKLSAEAAARGWTLGQPFVVQYCRVGILNEVGRLLAPRVAVLLIGERPGLATAESLSAYMAYRPQPGHTDAQRNLISNIHARGVGPDEAAARIAELAEQMMYAGTSGVDLKEA